MKVTFRSDKCHVYRVQDGEDEVAVFVWKEDGMSFGVHNILSTCNCENRDNCKHIDATMDKVLKVKFTFNGREEVE